MADEPAPEESSPDSQDRPDSPDRGRRARGCVLEIAETIVVTIVLFLGIQAFIAQPFKVEQHSMEATFLEGDYVLVDRLSHLWSPYARGQVIVFQPPASFRDGGKPLIKRVIGVGGDTIELRDGVVFVNGLVIDEPYLYRTAAGLAEPTDPNGTTSWLVPAGALFVMGDHREVSADSRIFGPIEVSSVVGRGLLRYWPFDRFGLIAAATYGGAPPR